MAHPLENGASWTPDEIFGSDIQLVSNTIPEVQHLYSHHSLGYS